MSGSQANAIRKLILPLGLATALVAATAVRAAIEPGATGQSQAQAGQKPGKKKTKATRKPKSADPAPTSPAGTPKTLAKPADGSLSFAREIAPILVANCTRCHGPGANNQSRFNQSTFAGLLKGGKTGKAIEPGNPEDSLIVQRVKGENGPKMPPGQNNLSAEAIEKLESWIKSGARLDAGLSADDALTKYAATPEQIRSSALAKLSAAERDKIAEDAGRERWKKADPKTTPEVTSSAHFLLFGNLPKSRASATVKALETQFASLNRLLSSGRNPVLPTQEKIGLYIFKDVSGYVEFVRGVENQEVEAGETARARLTVESPYVAVVDPLAWGDETTSSSSKKSSRSKKSSADDAFSTGPERTLTGLLTEQLTVSTVNKAGRPPRWVSLGYGAFAASKVEPRSPYFRKLRMEASRAAQLGWQAKATEALGGEGTAGSMRAVGFAIMEWIGGNSPEAIGPLVFKMAEGGQGKLDDAIRDVLQGNREEFLNGSGAWVQAQYGRIR